MSTDSNNVLDTISGILDGLGVVYDRFSDLHNYPTDRLVVYLDSENFRYAINLWVDHAALFSEVLIFREVSGDPKQSNLFNQILLTYNSSIPYFRFALIPSQNGYAILLGGTQSIKKVDSTWIGSLLDLYHQILGETADRIILVAEDLGLSFGAYTMERVFLMDDRQTVMILAGDSTTEAPPPDVRKKKKKRKG